MQAVRFYWDDFQSADPSRFVLSQGEEIYMSKNMTGNYYDYTICVPVFSSIVLNNCNTWILDFILKDFFVPIFYIKSFFIDLYAYFNIHNTPEK